MSGDTAGQDREASSTRSTRDDDVEEDSSDGVVVVLDEAGEVVLTQQQEAAFELSLQQALDAAAAESTSALPLSLAHVAELLPDADSSDGGSSATLAAVACASIHGGSTGTEDEGDAGDDAAAAPVWKVISTPKAGPKVNHHQGL